MSEKLPSGWANTFDDRWKHVSGASTEIYHLDGWFIAVASAPKRAVKEEAEKDRLNLIAGLEVGVDLLKAREQIDTLTARLDHAAELHDAIVKCLNAIGAPQEETIPWRIGAWHADVEALIASLEQDRKAALAELAILKTRRAGDHAEHLATLNEISNALNAYPTIDGVTIHYGPHELAGAVRAQGKALHEARKDRARFAGELDAPQKQVADLERQLEEKSSAHRGALTVVQRLREERDAMRTTIAKQQYQIDRIKSTACDAAPQLLRDSMRVTQEENARLRADLVAVTGERDALIKERPHHRLAGVFEMQDRIVEAAENAERQSAEIAALRQRVATSEEYGRCLLAALNAANSEVGK